MTAVVAPSVPPATAAAARPTCPLCGAAEAKPSWLGSTVYDGRTYAYVQCEDCRSLYCDPMPAGDVLSRMYGSEYQTVLADPADGGEREIARVVQFLAAGDRTGPGTFVDYGCGRGRLVQEAARLGWRAIGVEFDEGVAASVARATGLRVVGHHEALRSLRGCADVLHLGDVIEHLAAVDEELPGIVDLMAPGGMLIARGPLEGNRNLFTLVLKIARTLAGSRTSAMPPYHVMLATAEGQRRLFTRFGLTVSQFDVSEVSWPAARRLGWSELGSPRVVGMFVLRLLSQLVSAIARRDWGNRYFCTAGCRSRVPTRP